MSDLHGHEREGYSQDVKDQIIELIMAGNSVKRICREFPGMPKANTVFNWIDEGRNIYDADFTERYYAAHVVQAHSIIGEIAEDFEFLAPLNPDDFETAKEWMLAESLRSDYHKRANCRVTQAAFLVKLLSPRLHGDRQKVENTHRMVTDDGSHEW
jgi:transposase-like protein